MEQQDTKKQVLRIIAGINAVLKTRAVLPAEQTLI